MRVRLPDGGVGTVLSEYSNATWSMVAPDEPAPVFNAEGVDVGMGLEYWPTGELVALSPDDPLIVEGT